MKKLFVGKLSYSTTDSGLAALFEPYGPVISARVIKDKMSGDSRGFAFVELENDAQAARAITELDNQNHDGRSITVSEAREERSSGGNRSSHSRPWSDSRGSSQGRNSY